MMRILLDTNFLLLWKKFKVDVFEEIKRICDFKYDLYVLDRTLDELNKVRMPGYKVAFGLIKKHNIKVIKTQDTKRYVDDLLLDNLDKETALATVDLGLKKRAKQKGFRTITLRKGQHLILE